MGDEESQSRVEKLLALLKCKNEVVRELACANLGDACVNDAAVFESLLKRIHELLVGKQWDVRESAAQAIRQLARVSLGKWSGSASPAAASMLINNKFKFDLKNTLTQGCALLSCDESEYNCEIRESQDQQMRIVKQQLMIGDAVGELNVSEFLSTSDFEITSPSVENADAVAIVKKPKLDLDPVDERLVFSCADEEGRLFLSIVCRFCETLCSDLYKPDWTVRHGAALGLRQLLTVVPFSPFHRNILKHMFVVLALDRFSDFVGSQVVAPVRETICQAVGVVTSQAPVEMRVEFFDVVLQFLQLDTGHEWSCRYAGLLAAKYMLIAYYGNGGREGGRSVPEKFIRALLDCLNDDNEDVVIAAAEAISGVVEKLLETAPVFSSDLVSRCQSRLGNYINDDSNASLKGLLHILHCCPTFRVDLLSLAVYNSFLDHSIADIRRLYLSLAVKSVEMTPATVLADNAVRILGAFLPSLFTKALVEPDEQVFAVLRQFWCSLVEKMDPVLLLKIVSSMLSYWMAMLMVPWTNPMLPKEYVGSKRCVFLGGDGVLALPLKERRRVVLQVKRRAASLLAVLLKCISRVRGDEQSQELCQSVPLLFQFYLESNSVDQQSAACLTLCEWAAVDEEFGQFSNASLREKLHMLAETELIVYDETVGKLTQLNSLCSELESLVGEGGDSRPESPPPTIQSTMVAFSPAEAVQRCLSLMATLGQLVPVDSDLRIRGESLQEQILSIATDLQSTLQEVKVLTCCAGVLFGQLPPRLNPLIKPLMEYVRQSDDGCLLVDQVACCLSLLLSLCKDRLPAPNGKIVKNLTTLLGADKRLRAHRADGTCRGCCILSRTIIGRDVGQQQLEQWQEEQAMDMQAAANASKVLVRIVNDHQHRLAEMSAPLYDILFNPMQQQQQQQQQQQDQTDTSVQLLTALLTIKTVYGCLEQNIRRDLCQRTVPVCCELLASNCCVLRQAVCNCLTVFAESDLVLTLNLLLPNILPKLEKAREGLLEACLGPVEVIYCLVQSVGHQLNGVIRILASAILPKMMVSHRTIRECACECFGSLVQLMPLEGGEGALQGLCPELIALQKERCQFFSLLCNPTALPLVKLPSILEGELRPYQKEGVTWLTFLKNYSLHGILSDEMGLGKTLQTLCILYMAQRMSNNNNNNNEEKMNSTNNVSLILCPKTLVKHWVAEANKFFGHCTADFYVTTLDFDNVEELEKCNVLVASYESLRRENELLFDKHWFYCILDEGHVIRNHKTQLFKAALQIHAEHRLILTGTPVQNSVGELWSLFEFLMPGYLGTLQQFQQRYLKPICQSRDSKATSAEAHAGKKALEDLHKQVLPFILRRKKVDVCRDLPPKIIQDYYCSLSPVQQELYRAYSDEVQEKVASAAVGRESRKGITFSILTYLRKLCSHPLLVTDSEPDLMQSTLDKLHLNDVQQLNDISYSGKMQALKQLLSECSIGSSNLADCDAVQSNGISAHRALIFCQYKSALNLLCTFFTRGYFGKGISFLKMDGSVEPERRQELAQQFNSDPSIDLLILTTQIGGLGLNLTGADVVIFFDHDWNPCRDIQAMDRAHRIGQTRTVNVYRLISQGTLEEKIMRFQKFKNFMADTVIGDENKSLLSMAPDQLIDLLTLDRGAESTACQISSNGNQIQIPPPQLQPAAAAAAAAIPADNGGRGRRSMAGKDRLTASTGGFTDDLESTEKQYDKAFNAAAFSKSLQQG